MEITALKKRSGRDEGARIDNRAEIITDLWPHGLTAQGREMRACALPSRVDARGRAMAPPWPI